MATQTKPLSLPPELEADTQSIIDSMMTGQPLDAATAKRIRERGDRLREEIRQKHGILDIGVSAIRELRGDLPNP